MTDLERALAAGGQVVQPQQTDLERALASGGQVVPQGAPNAPPEESAGRSFALQATNVFGAAPVISGVIRKLTEGIPYSQGRDEYQAQIDAAKEQHPTASTIGSVASLVPETIIGGAVGKVAGAAGKAAGLAAKAAPFIEAHPLITKALEGAVGGAAYGAASGAGSAASHGQDVLPAAAESAAGGAVVGGVLGGAAAKVGDIIAGGVAHQNESIVQGAASHALPKKVKALASFIDDSDEIKPFASKTDITPADVIQENRDILGGARSSDHGTISDTRAKIDAKVSSYEAEKKQSYALVDQALGGGPEIGELTEALKNKAARVTERPYQKVLLNKAANLEEDYASISTDEARKRLATMSPEVKAAEVARPSKDVLERVSSIDPDTDPDSLRWRSAGKVKISDIGDPEGFKDYLNGERKDVLSGMEDHEQGKDPFDYLGSKKVQNEPVVLFRDSEGKLKIADGSHRIGWAAEHGQTEVPAIIGDYHAAAAPNAIATYAETLPEGQQWTPKQFLDLAAGGKAGSTEFDPEIRKAVEQLPFRFDPKLKIKSQDDLRKLLSVSQDEAESALGTLNATKNAKLASQNQQVIGSVMNKVLDAAKKSNVEGIEDAVQNIYDTNLKQSVLLRLNEALASKEDKLKLGKLGLGSHAANIGATLLGGHELLGAVGKVAQGDFGGAALDVGKAALVKAAPKAAAVARTSVTDAAAQGSRVLQRIQQAARDGSPKAKALLASLQASKSIGTAGAGAIGSTTSTTLGQQGNQ